MLETKSAVSVRNDWRSASSNGKMTGSGFTVSTFRRWSHWPAKFETRVSARGSSSIRRTWRSSTTGSLSLPRSARSSSSASGMVLHRKNDRRDASSTSLRRWARPLSAVDGSRSMRNRKSGDTSIASTAAWMPLSKSPPVAAALVERVERLDVGARHRTPERPVRERRENGSRAGRLLRRRRGTADEDRPPARRSLRARSGCRGRR